MLGLRVRPDVLQRLPGRAVDGGGDGGAHPHLLVDGQLHRHAIGNQRLRQVGERRGQVTVLEVRRVDRGEDLSQGATSRCTIALARSITDRVDGSRSCCTDSSA